MPRKQRKEYTVNQAYPELLKGLCTLLQVALQNDVNTISWYETFYRWFQEDLKLWNTKRQTGHHIGAFGGMGSFNDLVPEKNFPGGEKGFEYFYEAYRIVKELSYWCAQLWYQYHTYHPDRNDSILRIIFSGIPVTICTCPEDHRWMKEDINISFYTGLAGNHSEMMQCLSLIHDKGGQEAVNWLLTNKITPDPEPLLSEMKETLARAGIISRPEGCKACKETKMPCTIHYLIGDPLELSADHFRTEELTKT